MRFPAGWGDRYAVCPACRGRAPLAGQHTNMRCTRCNGLFDIAWNEPYLKSA
jgi:tRNA(Ile2) C34 agmatinyltransferase TiaS